MKPLHFFDIPKNSNVAIYGKGVAGSIYRLLIDHFRSDINVVAIIDSFESSVVDGIKCVRMTDYDSIRQDIDFIIVASAYYREIGNTLTSLGIDNWGYTDQWYTRLPIQSLEDVRSLQPTIEEYYNTHKDVGESHAFDEYIKSVENDLQFLRIVQERNLLPSGAMVQISKKCNLRCTFCGWEAWKSNSGFMDFELFKHIVDDLKSIGATLTLVGPQGEPTLHPMFTDFIEYAGRSGITTLLCTNGTGLTKRKIRCIVNSGINEVKISFSGYDQNSYESIYVRSNFKTVTKNIKMISDAVHVSKNDTKLVVWGIYPDSYSHVESFENFEQKTNNFLDSIMTAGKHGVSKNPHNFAGTVKTGMYNSIAKIYTNKNILSSHRPMCRQLLNPCIHYDGTVSSCGCHDMNCSMPIGHIKRNSLHEILKGEPLQRLVYGYLEKDYSVVPICKKCDYPF